MKRRLFLQFPLVASTLAAAAQKTGAGRGDKGFKVQAQKDRYLEELLIMGGQFDCKVSGKDTDGDLCIYDTLRQEKGGLPTICIITRMSGSMSSKGNSR